MANIAINIGIIFIIISIILFINHYTTIKGIEICKKNVKEYKKEIKKIYDDNNNKNNNNNKKKDPIPIIYSDRPTDTFKKMFLEPTIWLGYQNI